MEETGFEASAPFVLTTDAPEAPDALWMYPLVMVTPKVPSLLPNSGRVGPLSQVLLIYPWIHVLLPPTLL